MALVEQLWTERYRPKTIDGYVFRDAEQKKQIQEWINKKSIPHLLFSGSAGVGKCLIGAEAITIKVPPGDLSIEQVNQLDLYKTATAYQLPIQRLFQILNIDDIQYDTPTLTFNEIQIQGPTGFVPIRAFVKKRHTAARYSLSGNSCLSCSVDHIVFSNGTPVKIKECTVVDTIYGQCVITGVQDLGECDVYDVALDAPHQYITPNGVVHHNTTLAKILINQCGVDEFDVKEINASRDNSVEYIRNTVEGFVQTMPFGDFKVVLLDECLDEETLVAVLRDNNEQLIKIKDLDSSNDLVKSFSLEQNRVEWKTFALFDKGLRDTIEIEFENGEVVICTPEHKWYVSDALGAPIVVTAAELSEYMHVLT